MWSFYNTSKFFSYFFKHLVFLLLDKYRDKTPEVQSGASGKNIYIFNTSSTELPLG